MSGRIRVLNLGCGRARNEFPEASLASDIVGVDVNPDSSADIMHDLNQTPYPLESDAFDLIILQDVLEHLEDIPKVMREVHRVARHGALIRIRTPHYSSYYAYNDPTHKRLVGALVLEGFDVATPNAVYGGPWFRLTKRVILFPRVWRLLGVAALANRFPLRWEQLFAFVFRAENLLFELRAVKGDPGP
jgi:SAM-dependent methyltransferase